MFSLSGNREETVIYVSFEPTSKPFFVAYLPQRGGDCWAVLATDLSLPQSWRTVALDNLHMQGTNTSDGTYFARGLSSVSNRYKKTHC